MKTDPYYVVIVATYDGHEMLRHAVEVDCYCGATFVPCSEATRAALDYIASECPNAESAQVISVGCVDATHIPIRLTGGGKWATVIDAP